MIILGLILGISLGLINAHNERRRYKEAKQAYINALQEERERKYNFLYEEVSYIDEQLELLNRIEQLEESEMANMSKEDLISAYKTQSAKHSLLKRKAEIEYEIENL